MVVLGGEGGAAISTARSLGRRGIAVYLILRKDTAEARSRYVRHIRIDSDGGSLAEAWAHYLLSSDSDYLRGSLLLAASDSGIQVLQDQRAALGKKYLLDLSNPVAQELMLNKLTTYRAAQQTGVPAPRFWQVVDEADVLAHQDEYVYPMMLKPEYTHLFKSIYGTKYLLAKDLEELVAVCQDAWQRGVSFFLLEYIPGPDGRLCSYYTYIDEDGSPLVDFTKQIIRRNPPNSGQACYHVTGWMPEVRDLGVRLLKAVDLRGLGNVEFKLDERDGKLKIIECNARFTASNHLVILAGLDLPWMVYTRALGWPQGARRGWHYREGLTLWRPWPDFRSFLSLRQRGELGFWEWLGSVLRPQHFVFFSLRDPLPWLFSLLRRLQRIG